MKIGEFARAARTTTRTVRHYHQLGLLPEPARRPNGYREYAISDLVRMLRITWLTGAGVPLAKVGELLDEESAGGSVDALARDLDVVAQTIAAERDRLGLQLEALGRISDSLQRGGRLSVLPDALADALNEVQAGADPALNAVLAQDREMLEVMALAGELSDEVVTAYVQLAGDPEQLRLASRAGAAFAGLEGKQPQQVSDQIDDVVALFLSAPIVRTMLTGVDVDDPPTRESASFYLPDAAQREVVMRLLARLS